MTGAPTHTATHCIEPIGAIDAVVFDLGGVLLDCDPRRLYRLAGLGEEDIDHLLSEVFTAGWIAAVDAGQLALADAVEMLAVCHPSLRDHVEAWLSLVEVARPLPKSVAILEELVAAGVRCFALTNMSVDLYEELEARHPFLGLFEAVIVSAREGAIKPEPTLFDTLLARHALSPSRVLFVDDVAANVAAARGRGMRAHLFAGPATLALELERWMLLSSGSAVR